MWLGQRLTPLIIIFLRSAAVLIDSGRRLSCAFSSNYWALTVRLSGKPHPPRMTITQAGSVGIVQPSAAPTGASTTAATSSASL
jgi:ABC-type molybdate transport system substrate-binding protein